ncbi:alpha/beta fold hydrolase [Archangium violaceum]|uniref:alpha/beta fold hydrolase n=1 Tax=Archangium violaceum TaxID=83451 RepID=UPI00193B46C3|nr:alpha/beta fold hydrolase [Archangium violaceum]QRK05455.1 alpha/beta fold hydrolase [Archangium violaceum]
MTEFRQGGDGRGVVRGLHVPVLLFALLVSGCATGPGLRAAVALPSESLRIRTSDGWSLAMRRIPSEGPARGRPVLLVPGLASGDVSLLLEPAHSLAGWLAAHGREVWTVSVRGTGDSDRTDAAAGRMPGYGLDTLWREDFRAALRTVRQRTRSEQVDVVAYSLGALLLYAYLAEDGEGVGAAVTLAGPTRLDRSSPWLVGLAELGSGLVSREDTLDMGLLSSLTAPVQAWLRGNPVERFVFDTRNTPRERWRRFASCVFGELSGGVVEDFVRMSRTGRFTSREGGRDYREGLARVRVPVLVMAGEGDQLASVRAVHDGYLALGGPKAWRLLGTRTGLAADYGHVDLILGDRAPLEVWTPLLVFLERAASGRVTR